MLKIKTPANMNLSRFGLFVKKIHSKNIIGVAITLNKKCFSASGFYNCNQTG